MVGIAYFLLNFSIFVISPDPNKRDDSERPRSRIFAEILFHHLQMHHLTSKKEKKKRAAQCHQGMALSLLIVFYSLDYWTRFMEITYNDIAKGVLLELEK